jgi:hypothetical protein
MRDSAPNRPTLDVVNAVGSSVSLRLVADATFAPLARKFDVDLIATPSIGEHERLFFRAQRAAGKPPRQSLTFHLAHELAYAAYACPGLLKDQLRVLYTGWELEQLTDELILELAGADVLLTFSEFTARTFRRYFPNTPVITVPVCPPLYFEARDDRRRFSLPPDAVIFLCVFDPISGMDRKNPLDVLDASNRLSPTGTTSSWCSRSATWTRSSLRATVQVTKRDAYASSGRAPAPIRASTSSMST